MELRIDHPCRPHPFHPTVPVPDGPKPAHHPSQRARPRQFCDVLHTVLDVDVALLTYIEHQVLVLLDWRVPMSLGLHQTYADAIFDAASHKLGRRIAAPQVVLDFGER